MGCGQVPTTVLLGKKASSVGLTLVRLFVLMRSYVHNISR